MTEKHKNFISAVVYVHNADNVITSFLNVLYSILRDNFEKFEIICANDFSTDKSKEKIQALAKDFEDCVVSVINMSHCQGIEAAMHAGVDLAIGDFVFEFDNIIMDYDSNLIMQVYSHLLQGYDIVSCGKTSVRFFSKLFYAIYNYNSSGKYNVKSETFRLLSRRAINRIHSISAYLPYRKAIYSNCGLEFDFISYKPTGAESSYIYAHKKPIDTAFTSLIIFTDVAYRLSVFFSIIMTTFMFGFGIYTVIIYLGEKRPVEGWAPLMGLMSAGFLGIFVLLTIIIKYFNIILKNTFSQQKYLISSIDK